MKKILASLALVFAVVFGASARDTYSRDASSLPQPAQIMLSNNFKAKVAIVKIEKELGHVMGYDVTLNDGTEIEFDAKGNWKDIEVPAGKAVPAVFIPEAAAQYLAREHKSSKVVGIEHSRKGYEVELDNGVDIKFDTNGAFLRYD